MPRITGSGATTATTRPSGMSSAPARFEPGPTLKTGMPEASDVAALPGGRFIVVGDRRDSACIIDASGKRERLELPGLKNGKSQLEGVTYDPVRHHLFVSREESRELLRYEWDATRKGAAPVLEKTVELPAGGPANKGVEGLTYLPQAVSPTGEPQLLLAREGKPRELSLIGDGGKGKPLPIKLEKEVLAVCRDFSAATVDPKTGHLFVSSDESAAVAQVRLVRDGDKVVGKLVQAIALRDAQDKPLTRVEGLSFNERGDLFVLTENDGKLHQLNRR